MRFARLAALFVVTCLAPAFGATSAPRNVLILLADDYGAMDLGVANPHDGPEPWQPSL